MKKILAFILTAAMLLSFTACVSTKTEEHPDPKPETGTVTDKEETKPETKPEETEKEEEKVPEVTEEPKEEEKEPETQPETNPEPEVKPEETTPVAPPAETLPEVPEETPAEQGENEPLNILNTIWASYSEDNKFPAAGGDYDVMAMGTPGAFGVGNAENLDYMLGMPQDQAANLACAASLTHMMNANTFTCGAYQLNDGVDLAAVAEAIKNNILGRQWMCGFPDTLLVYQIGDGIVISAFGNAEMIAYFGQQLTAAYADAVLLYEEALNF